jgi:hypothetical protein
VPELAPVAAGLIEIKARPRGAAYAGVTPLD